MGLLFTVTASGCSSSARLIPPSSPTLLSLGTSRTLSVGAGAQAVRGQFIVTRVWPVTTPQAELGLTIPEALQRVSAPRKVIWEGIEVTVNISGQRSVELGTATGPGVPVLFFSVNGHDPWPKGGGRSLLTELAFAVGVPGCPYPFSNSHGVLVPGSSVSGCVAIAVPAGRKVTTVGFDLTSATGGAAHHVAEWRV